MINQSKASMNNNNTQQSSREHEEQEGGGDEPSSKNNVNHATTTKSRTSQTRPRDMLISFFRKEMPSQFGVTKSQISYLVICATMLLVAVAIFEVRLATTKNQNMQAKHLLDALNDKTYEENPMSRLLRILLLERYSLILFVSSALSFLAALWYFRGSLTDFDIVDKDHNLSRAPISMSLGVPEPSALLSICVCLMFGIAFLLSSAIYLAGKYVVSQGDCYWPMLTACCLVPQILSRKQSKSFLVLFILFFSYIAMLNWGFSPVMMRWAPFITDDEVRKKMWIELFQQIRHSSFQDMVFIQLESLPIYALFMYRTQVLMKAQNDSEKKERRVIEQEKMMEAILSSLPAFFWVVDRNLVFRFCRGAALHDALESQTNYEGVSLPDFLKKLDFSTSEYDTTLNYYSEALEGKHVVFEMINAGSQKVCFKSWLKPLRDDDNNVVGCVGLALDMKDLKVLQKQKEESEENYKSLVESINDILFRVGPDLKIQFIGNMKHDLVEEDWIGRSMLDLFFNNVSLQKQVSRKMSNVFAQKKRCYWEWSSADKSTDNSSQEIRYYTTKAHPIIKEDVAIAATIVTSDVTERRTAVEQQRIAEKCEVISKSKTEFIAQMSHEIRNPLNAILGSLQLLFLTSDTMTCIQCDHLADARENANSLMNIVSDVLDLNKIESGKLELVNEPNSVLDIVESTCSSISTQAYKKGLRIHSFVDPRIPSSLICDKNRIGQILLNYASNALKFTKAGYIILQATLLSETPSSATVRFECIDTGVGISKEDQKTIFDQYTQVLSTDSAQQENKGWGLGLRICSLLGKDLMKGKIGVESSCDLGSTFYFEVTLPKVENETTCIANLIPRANFDKVLAVSIPIELERYLSEYLKYMGVKKLHCFHQECECLEFLKTSVKPSERVVIFTDAVGGMANMNSNCKIISLIENSNWYRAQQAENCIPLRLPIRLKHLISVINGLALHPSTGANLLNVPLLVPASSLRVLYVEDNAVNRKILCLMLEKIGITHIDQAVNGQEGWEKVCQAPEPYSIIWMDLKMPVMSGQACAAKIRELNDERAKVPIIAVTANADARIIHQLDSTFNDVMFKPIGIEKVITMINKYCRNKPTSLAVS